MPYYVDNFKPEPVELYQAFEPLPEEGYNASIEQAEIKNNFNTNVIALRFRINEPNIKYNNRVIFINLNINSDHPDPEKRAKIIKFETQKLNQICTVCSAVQEGQPLDLESLLDKPMHIHLGQYTNTKNKTNNTLYGVGKEKEPKEVENYLTGNNDYSPQEHTEVQPTQAVAENNFDDEEIPF